MKDILSKVVIFAVGAVIGSAATWQYFKKKYEKIAQEEIDSVKERFTNWKPMEEPKTVEPPKEPEQGDIPMREVRPEVVSYHDLLQQCGYAEAGIFEKLDEKEESDVITLPYVIRPDDLGDSDYDCVTLMYYADGTLANTYDEVIRNVDELVGRESLTHFGENPGDEDTVYVRNDDLKIDFEICRDTMTFAEAVGGD